MKKNLPLYILLIFLIIVNGFFVFNYLGRPNFEKDNPSKDPASFLTEELGFSELQIKEIEVINKKQHENMMTINHDVRRLKDELFSKLSSETINEQVVDSITTLIGLKQKEMDKMAFYHFRSIQEVCNDSQKEKFKTIMNDALQRGSNNRERLPNKEGEERKGPPPGGMGGDRQGPPPPRP